MKSQLNHRLILFLVTPLAVVEAATLHVAPTGDDSAPGTLDAPFATLDQAVSMPPMATRCCFTTEPTGESRRPP